MTLISILAPFIILIGAIVFHEYAHGWSAEKLGDPTAKMMGRLTLNPIKHVDPVGTIALPLMLYLSHKFAGTPFILFGWAKPVPVNFSQLRNPKRDMIWVALAGPVINIILAICFSFLLGLHISGIWDEIFTYGILINLVLAVFNMIPIPPLDGSRVVMGLLPINLARSYARVERFGIPIVMLLLITGHLWKIIWPIVILLAAILGA